MDALDPEGRALFEATWLNAAGEDGGGERGAAHVIAQTVPDPVALTYRNLVVRCTELVDQFLAEPWDGHSWRSGTCEARYCPGCNEYRWDAVLSFLLEELNDRRQAWLSSDDRS